DEDDAAGGVEGEGLGGTAAGGLALGADDVTEGEELLEAAGDGAACGAGALGELAPGPGTSGAQDLQDLSGAVAVRARVRAGVAAHVHPSREVSSQESVEILAAHTPLLVPSSHNFR